MSPAQHLKFPNEIKIPIHLYPEYYPLNRHMSYLLVGLSTAQKLND